MKRIRTEDALRKQISKIIKESQGGEAGSGDSVGHGSGGFHSYELGYGAGGGMGVGVSGGALYKAFVEPIKDIGRTIVGQAKEVGRKIVTFLQIAVEAVLSALIPLVTAEYDKIYEKEKVDLQRIRSEYRDVYERINSAVSDNDIAVLAFMAYPAPVLTAKVVSAAPSAIRTMLGALTAGYSEKLLSRSSEKNYFRESFIRLTESGEEKRSLSDVVGSKKFITAAVGGSLQAATISRAAREAYKSFLDDVEKSAKETIGKLQTIEDVEKISGGSEEIDKIKSLSPEERSKSEPIFLDGVKESLKRVYIEKLNSRIKKALNGGIPETSPFIRDHASKIEIIKNL